MGCLIISLGDGLAICRLYHLTSSSIDTKVGMAPGIKWAEAPASSHQLTMGEGF